MLLIFISFLLQASNSEWELLSTVEITKEYDEFMAAEVDKPVFSQELKDREGTTIILEGFMIPLEQGVEQDYFVLSQFPFQSCFFCGGAGPETVAEVFLEKEFAYTDERIKVEGTLELNDVNPLQLFYVLRDTKVEKL